MNAGKPLRTWVWKPKETLGTLWVTERDEGKYVRLDENGALVAYESDYAPINGMFGHNWEEVK